MPSVCTALSTSSQHNINDTFQHHPSTVSTTPPPQQTVMVPASAAAFPRPSGVGGVDVGSFQPLLIATLLLVNVPLDPIDSLMLARKLTAAANIHAIDTCFDNFDRSGTAKVVTDGDTPGSRDEAAGDTALQEILLQQEERCVLRVTSSLAAASSSSPRSRHHCLSTSASQPPQGLRLVGGGAG